MKKFDVDNTFNPSINLALEASAGTGKTYSIVQMVKKLVNDGISLDKLLIVTYTEKAAGELKDRVREEIKNADVDSASIFTIHSFCQTAIKEFGLSAKAPFELNVIDDSYLEKFVDRYIREGDIVDEVSTFLSYGAEISFNSLKSLLIEGVKKYYLDYQYDEDSSVVSIDRHRDPAQDLEFYLKLNKAPDFDTLCSMDEDIDYYASILRDSKDEKSNNFYSEIENCFNNRMGLTFDGTSFKQSKKWPKEDEEIEAFEFFKGIKEYFFNPKKKYSIAKSIASKYLKDFYKAWQIEKENNKNQSFDDMIRTVRESILHEESLKKKLQEKYTYAIIDEFQDTNQKQFDIFSKIFMEDNDHHIIVVGDPKQSIYSFQGADVEVYKTAIDLIESNGGEKQFLSKNYRSTKNMVSSCNKLFSFYNFTGTDFEGSEYLDESAGDKKEHKVLYCEEETKAFWIHPEALEDEPFAKLAVEQILDCCSIVNGHTKLQVWDARKDKGYRDVSFKDFVILARTRTELPPIEKELKNAGIPFIRYKDTGLFTGKECAQWIAILEAINTPDFTGVNRKTFKKALFTDFFGLSLAEANDDKYNRDDLEEVDLFNHWRSLRYEYRWEDLIDDVVLNSKLTETLSSRPSMQSFAIFKQIGNYCIDYLFKNNSLDGLIDNLKQLLNGGNVEDDEGGTIVEKSTNFDCVRTMTIHASKGLQFPVVIPVAGFKKPYFRGSAFTYHDKNDETNESKLRLIFERNEILGDEEEAEWKRLFYVCFTRAQFLMIIPHHAKPGMYFIESSLVSYMDAYPDDYREIEPKNIRLSELQELSAKVLERSSNNSGDRKDSNEEKAKQDAELSNLIKDVNKKRTYKHSYSSLSHGNIVDEIEETEDDQIDKENTIIEEDLTLFDKEGKQVEGLYDNNLLPVGIPSDYPKGAKIGTAIHEVFEKSDYTNFDENTVNESFIKNEIGTNDSWIKYTVDITKNVLDANLPVIKGGKTDGSFLKLSSITNENKKAEAEFNFNLLNERLKNYCNGFIDLMFKNGECFSIVDWKSDTLNDDFLSYSDKDELKKHVDERYSIQRVLYSYCLIKWLKIYYPSLSEEEIFNNHFGGVYYVFVRGCNPNTSNGVYAQTWNSWDDLKQSFKHVINEKVKGVKY